MDKNFDDKIKTLENSMDPEHKKNNGIFYTDLFLANLMINDLHLREDSLIIDPCCGGGTFIEACQLNGFDNAYGIDNDGKAIKHCKKEIKKEAFFKYDTLSNNGEKLIKKAKLKNLADFVVGNPPYAKITSKNSLDVDRSKDYLFARELENSGNNLFIAALIRSFELLKTDGIVSYIIPKNFLHINSYSLLRRRLLFEKTIISITDIGIYFPQVRGEQIIITIKNSKSTNNEIAIKKLVDGSFKTMMLVPQSKYEDEILLFNSQNDYDVYSKLSHAYQTVKDVLNGTISRGKSKDENDIAGKDIRKFGFKVKNSPVSGNKIFIQNIYSSESGIIAALGGNYQAKETVTVLVDGDNKMCKYLLGILHSRLCNYYLCKFIYNNSRLTMHTDGKYIEKIPLIAKDNDSVDAVVNIVENIIRDDYLSESWFENLEELNQLIYKIYGLTRNEIEHIETEIRLIQSERWFINAN